MSRGPDRPGARIAALAASLVISLALTGGTPRAAQAGRTEPGSASPPAAATGAITGTGTGSVRVGRPGTIALHPVMLVPVSRWSQPWWERCVLGGGVWGGFDPQAAREVRAVVADSSGRFTFDHVPAGEYYVQSSILWVSQTLSDERPPVVRLIVGGRITLAPGQHAEIALAPLRFEDGRSVGMEAQWRAEHLPFGTAPDPQPWARQSGND